MTHYKITTPSFVSLVVTSSDLIVQASPVLHWTVGLSFSDVRAYCRSYGWQIEPLCDDSQPDWLEYDGRVYQLHWNGEAIARITVIEDGEQRDILFDELPDVLRRAL